MSEQDAVGVGQEHKISRPGEVVMVVSIVAVALLGCFAYYQIINSAPISDVNAIAELAQAIGMSGGVLFVVIEVLNPVSQK